MPQPKDKDWPNRYKNKTSIYAVYRDLPQTKGHIQTESEEMKSWKKVFHVNGDQRKQE